MQLLNTLNVDFEQCHKLVFVAIKLNSNNVSSRYAEIHLKLEMRGKA